MQHRDWLSIVFDNDFSACPHPGQQQCEVVCCLRFGNSNHTISHGSNYTRHLQTVCPVKLTRMETHSSVSAMADAYAQKAVIIAREFNASLDYSENSLMELESILAQLALDLPPGGPSSDDLTEMCKMWGCYFGEVVRRRFGGDWSIETYPGKQFATLTLSVGGNRLFPSMKIHRRLTSGEADNVWTFYKMVKAKLETVAGSKMQ